MNQISIIKSKYSVLQMLELLNIPQKGGQFKAVWEGSKEYRVKPHKLDPSKWVNFSTKATKKSGDVLDLYCLVHNCDIKRAIKDLSPDGVVKRLNPATESKSEDVKILKHFPVSRRKNLDYLLHERGLWFEIIRKYCEVVKYRNQAGEFWGVGFRNDSGGYEIRNENFRGCAGVWDVSTIRVNSKPKAAVFEGFIDFLSCAQMRPDITLNNNCVILHGARKWERVSSEFSEVLFFGDNDPEGDRTLKCLVDQGREVRDMRDWFANHRDINEFYLKEVRNV